METIISNFTTLPTLSFFAIWVVLFSLLFFSIIVGLDMDLGIDVDVDSSSPIVPSFMINRGITKIPLILSFFIVFSIGLALSYFLQWVIIPDLGLSLFQGDLNTLEVILGILSFIPLFIISLYVSSPVLNFLGKYIKNPEKAKPLNLVGRECTLITGTVAEKFGEAIIKEGSKEYRINVISKEGLVLNDRAIVSSGKDENGDHYITKIT